jgi:SAM-dependent methyltransferase
MKTVAHWPLADPQFGEGIADTPRVARRWMAVLESLGGKSWDRYPVLEGRPAYDLGCFEGDFTALLALEGAYAVGVDQGGFRTGYDSIDGAREIWAGLPRQPFGDLAFQRSDLRHWLTEAPQELGVVLCFSTWAYMFNEDADSAAAWLEEVIRRSDVLFFETQYAGDGPGPVWIANDDICAGMLYELGAKEVDAIATIPVTGRPASRTVWRVE